MKDVRRLGVALGIALALSGLVSQVLTFYPPQWNRPEWEVAYVGEFSATVGPLAMGLSLLAALGLASKWVVARNLVAALAISVGVWSFVGAVIVALDLPLVLIAVRGAEGQAAAGFQVVAFKAVGLAIVYGIGLPSLGWVVFRTPPKRG